MVAFDPSDAAVTQLSRNIAGVPEIGFGAGDLADLNNKYGDADGRS